MTSKTPAKKPSKKAATKTAVKAPAKAPTKAPTQSAKKVPAKSQRAPTKKAPTPAPEKASAPKAKLVRDSFTIPKTEYTVLNGLKDRAISLKHHAKKSEVLRAGIAMLASLGDQAFLTALKSVPSLKTGRPKSAKR